MSKNAYNIYMIQVERVEALKQSLLGNDFKEITLNQELIPQSDYTISLFFLEKDNSENKSWIHYIFQYATEPVNPNLWIYGAVVLYENDSECFAVSYGNAHFYLDDYCDYNFGTKIAERLIDLEKIKAQQIASHGTRKSKIHTDYLRESILTYRGGEIPTFVKGESINANEWGNSINCGISAQFKWGEAPFSLTNKFHKISTILQSDANIALPRLLILDENRNRETIHNLNQRLAEAILTWTNDSNEASLSIPSYFLLGTNFISNNSCRYKIIYNRKGIIISSELSISSLKTCLDEYKIDIMDAIESLKICFESEDGNWTTAKPLQFFIEFVLPDSYCLRQGKWCQFNQEYLEQVFRDVERIEIENHTDDMWAFSTKELKTYAKQKGMSIPEKNTPYETYYNTFIAEQINGELIHPKDELFEESKNGRYKLELCDFVCDSSMYFVKLGKPQNYVYAVDQALLSIEKLKQTFGEITLPSGKMIYPKEFVLVFITDRKTIVHSWRDTFSVLLLIHLAELRNELNSMGISLKVIYSYSKG